jgi:type IV pilus assembly protein PilY1
VTDPVGMTAAGETGVAGKVLWEFTRSTLGYTYGLPLVMKTAKYGWVAVFTSGYNNADGKGYFIFVNPQTGAFLEEVSTGVGSTTNDAGLAHANAFIVDATNGTADAIYAGDLLGNLWRLDVRATSGAYPTPTKIATFTDGTNPQPVTTDPSIEIDPVTKKRMVMVGTGRLLADTDISSTQVQTFYSIVDGNNAVFTTAPVSPLAFPYTRSVLFNNSNSLRTDGTKFDTTSQAGWYEDLGTDSSTGIGWRVIGDSTTLLGSVSFASVLPSGDPCSPSGQSRVYANQYSTGLSTALDPNTLTATAFVSLAGTVTNLRYVSVGGKAELVVGTNKGSVGQINISPQSPFQLRRLNWRELQSVD